MKRKNLLGVLLSAVLSISAMGVIPHMVYADTNSDVGNDYTGYAGGYIAGNLERAMAADGRFGGHIVSGHIDGTGVIRSLIREENAIWVSIGTSPQILHLIVEKGSICIDGISLTVAKVEEEGFQVSVIPHTGEETTLLEKVPGDSVNLENDVIGKYVERLLGLGKSEEEKKESGITMEFLQEFGF